MDKINDAILKYEKAQKLIKPFIPCYLKFGEYSTAGRWTHESSSAEIANKFLSLWRIKEEIVADV